MSNFIRTKSVVKQSIGLNMEEGKWTNQKQGYKKMQNQHVLTSLPIVILSFEIPKGRQKNGLIFSAPGSTARVMSRNKNIDRPSGALFVGQKLREVLGYKIYN